MNIYRLMTTLTALVLSGVTTQAMAADEVAYPDSYRDWKHVKSMIIQPGHPLEDPFAGIHHIYANSAAQQGLETGNYADGATFVFDLLESKEQDKTLQEGDRKLIGVMIKSRADYADTGGWGFEAFAGNSRNDRVVKDGGASCFACHQARKAQGYVFTESRR